MRSSFFNSKTIFLYNKSYKKLSKISQHSLLNLYTDLY
jgi:hypothetical protein